MDEGQGSVLRIALVADSVERRSILRQILEERGLVIGSEKALTDLEAVDLADGSVGVILIELSDEPEGMELNDLLEAAAVPVLFSERETHKYGAWADKLVEKLRMLAGRSREPFRPPTASVQRSPVSTSQHEGPVERVYVVGASIGGPEALRCFLAELPIDFPAAFLIAQHIGRGFDARLAAQLDRTVPVSVRLAEDGDLLRCGEALVVPAGGRMEISDCGEIVIGSGPWSGAHSPTIDDVADTVVKVFGNRSGLVLLSGMGHDGAAGAVRMAEVGAFVWAQDEASCVISSIPDAARRCGVVEYSGAPVDLARRLVERLRELDRLASAPERDRSAES
jgi:chemosensory pili system protein ChpB (putative protein-glutamate methylesterase)